MNNQNQGITLVILSFERMRGLTALLESIVKQDLKNLDLEVMICNNSAKIILKKTGLTKLGRLLKKMNDLKIFNCSHNWGCQAKYQIAAFGKYDTIMFLDDDVILLDENFISDMYQEFRKLKEADILSGFCNLWTSWNEKSFDKATLFCRELEIDKITKADVAGSGISMFSKKLALKEDVLNMFLNYPNSYDWSFSLIAQMKYGSQVYYFPVAKRMNFHAEKVKNRISKEIDYYKNTHELYKKFWQNGYKPILSRLPKDAKVEDYPELKAAKVVQAKNYDW